MSEYSKQITYTFEAGRVEWQVLDYSDTYMYVKETRCNGQEDSHVSFIVHFENGKWDFEDPEYSREHISSYMYEETPDELLAFFDINGAPK